MPQNHDTLDLLAIETTCDETAAAVIRGPRPPRSGVPTILSSVVASQVDLHQPFGGVVPEIASRAHTQRIVPIIDQALARAGVALADLGAVAVATRPGLAGALVVGLTAAKCLAAALEIPLVAIDHLEGHLYACQLAYPETSIYPCLGLVVSGGHTSFFHCESPLEATLLGGTIDDAAGEAFDKVASLLGLGYPGGPLIERAARGGNPKAYDFPRSFLNEDRIALSFSGLKTAVLYALRGPNAHNPMPTLDQARIADVAASFQEALVDAIVGKAKQALRQTGLQRLAIGGGVAANARLRERLTETARDLRVELHIPPLSLCTDNAALGAIAFPMLAAGLTADFDLDVTPGLVRPSQPRPKHPARSNQLPAQPNPDTHSASFPSDSPLPS